MKNLKVLNDYADKLHRFNGSQRPSNEYRRYARCHLAYLAETQQDIAPDQLWQTTSIYDLQKPDDRQYFSDDYGIDLTETDFLHMTEYVNERMEYPTFWNGLVVMVIY